MIYPSFLHSGSTIGVCPTSDGIGEEKMPLFDKSLNYLKSIGYNIVETKSVRSGAIPAASAEDRQNEFNGLLTNKNVDMIWVSCGGDFANEVLSGIKKEDVLNNVKWIEGFSDPTFVLFYITTNFDIATIYGRSAGNYEYDILHKSQLDNLEFIKGNIVIQNSFDMCQRERIEGASSFNLDTKVNIETPNGDVDVTGRLIGGCIDCLNFYIGSEFDNTKDFIEKYKDDGFIWYFDNFALSVEDLYFALWRMKSAGWFKYAKGFVFGRVCYPSTHLDGEYKDAIIRALGKDVPIIMDADVTHVYPTWTMINGAVGHVTCKDGKASIEQFLK